MLLQNLYGGIRRALLEGDRAIRKVFGSSWYRSFRQHWVQRSADVEHSWMPSEGGHRLQVIIGLVSKTRVLGASEIYSGSYRISSDMDMDKSEVFRIDHFRFPLFTSTFIGDDILVARNMEDNQLLLVGKKGKSRVVQL